MAEYGDSLLLMLFWWEDNSEASGCDDWSRSNATDQDRACRGQREGQCVLKRGSVVSEGGFFQYIKKKKNAALALALLKAQAWRCGSRIQHPTWEKGSHE